MKSPVLSAEMLLSERVRSPVMPARCESVTLAQSLTSDSLARMASRTSWVRLQMPEDWARTVLLGATDIEAATTAINSSAMATAVLIRILGLRSVIARPLRREQVLR